MYVEFTLACLVRSAVHGQTPFCMQNSFVYVGRVSARSTVHGQSPFTIIVTSSSAGTCHSSAAMISDAEPREVVRGVHAARTNTAAASITF